jgi:hypothetical protein
MSRLYRSLRAGWFNLWGSISQDLARMPRFHSHAIRLRIEPDRLQYDSYRYRPSAVYPSASLSATDIQEVIPDWFPPTVRTTREEFLVVPATRREELVAFAANHGIPQVRRGDVWDLLLEPFLDTEFDRAHQARTLATLESWGLPRDRVAQIRARVGGRVFAYNVIAWEWIHLGLFDVLDVMAPGRSGKAFALFYHEAMEIAALGPILENTSKESV